MKKILSRQHADADISEIVGGTIESVLAVRGTAFDRVQLIYVLIHGIWLRVFLDAGVLFLDVCDGPDAEDDLDAGDEYFDLSGAFGIRGEQVARAFIRQGVFKIAFKSGAELIFEQYEEEARVNFLK